MRDWLRLFRAQTAAATVYSIIVPYILAGGRDWTLVLVLGVLGTLLHWFSFGHNSVMDYWYDIHDPNKQHHPLESGRIRLGDAHVVIHTGLAVITMAMGLLTLAVAPNPSLALVFLLSYVAWGHAYNDGLDKHTRFSWVPISLCFTFLAGYGWLLAADDINIYMLLILAWAFSTILYQIAWEGNLKDVWNPSDNATKFLALLGGPAKARYLMSIIRAGVNTAIIMAYAYLLKPDVNTALAWITIFILTSIYEILQVIEIHQLSVELKPEARNRLLEAFGKAEAIEFWRFMSLIIISCNIILYGLLLLYGLLYFVGMNRALWRSKFGPRV